MPVRMPRRVRRDDDIGQAWRSIKHHALLVVVADSQEAHAGLREGQQPAFKG